jgi:hypothetical protein
VYTRSVFAALLLEVAFPALAGDAHSEFDALYARLKFEASRAPFGEK